jgi:hypothetical protein
MVGLVVAQADAMIDRKGVVQAHNVKRTTSGSTPLQVGNGNFAFGVDITGLQSFSEFNTLSSWGFHNTSLPTTPGQTEISGKSLFPQSPRLWNKKLIFLDRLYWN